MEKVRLRGRGKDREREKKRERKRERCARTYLSDGLETCVLLAYH